MKASSLNSGPTLKAVYFSLFTIASEIGGRVNRKYRLWEFGGLPSASPARAQTHLRAFALAVPGL